MKLEFVPIRLQDQKVFQKFIAQCPQATSDYTFVNVWSWAPVYGLEWAQADTMLWLRQDQPLSQYWAPIGNWQTLDWETHFKRFPQLKAPIVRIPEPLALLWKTIFGQKISLMPDRDQFDYIYDATALLTLKGNLFHKKRNLLHQFQKKYAYQYLNLSPEFMGAAMAMQHQWCRWRECDSDLQLTHENQAIERVFALWEKLDGVFGGGIQVEEKMIAYTIGERLHTDTLVIHFEKASTDYKGSYQAIQQMFLEHALHGEAHPGIPPLPVIKWVNREQDLGDMGLRKAKTSYHPVKFLKKYRIDFS